MLDYGPSEHPEYEPSYWIDTAVRVCCEATVYVGILKRHEGTRVLLVDATRGDGLFVPLIWLNYSSLRKPVGRE